MLKKINLQLLGGGAGEDPEQAEQPEPSTDEGEKDGKPAEGSETESEEKLYTQAELDRLVGLQKKKIPNKDEWAEFKAWKAQQTQEQSKDAEASTPDTSAKELAEAKAQLLAYRRRDVALKAGIAIEFADYAVFEVGKLTDDEADFETELTKWLKSHERYKTGHNGSTGMRHGSSASSKLSGVEEAFYAKNPELRPKE